MKYLALLLILFCNQVWSASEDVTLETEFGPLSGTLDTPDSGSPTALILFVSGSGPTDRDGNTSGLPGKNNSLKYLSMALVQAGYATLRFDKRLIGKSAKQTLSEQDLRFDTYIDDVRLWAAYAKGRLDIPFYILGHSEGALIATVAAQNLELAGLILIAGPSRRASDIILSQTRQQLPPNLMAQTEQIISELLTGRTVDSPPRELDALFRHSVQPYLISWFKFDPAEELTKLNIPILLIYGTTDIQIPVSEGRLMKSANPSAELIVIEGMNHILKYVKNNIQAQIASYSDPDLPIADTLVENITQFLH